MKNNKIENIIHFREGFVLLCQAGLYFYPIGDSKAYSLNPYERKELCGKHYLAFTSAAGIKYQLTYEYDEGEFISARLIFESYRSKGTNVKAESIAKMNEHLQNGTLTLVKKINEPTVARAASFSDGRLFLLLQNLLDEPNDILMIQQADNSYKKVGLKNGIIGGRTVMYTTDDDIPVKFEYGSHVEYGDQILKEEKQIGSISAYGLDVKRPPLHLDPFSQDNDHIRIVLSKLPAVNKRPNGPKGF